jgi:hypothetical protein
MADVTGLTVTVNDFSGIEAFRTPNNNLAIDNIDPQQQDQEYETDSVELSEESINLSRQNGNVPLEELLNYENQPLAESLQANPTAIETDLFATDTEGFPVTTDEFGIGSTVGLTASQIDNPDVNNEEAVAPPNNAGASIVTGPLQEEGIRATGAETFIAPENVPIESQDREEEAASIVAAEVTAAEVTANEINADSIIRETEQGASIREENNALNRDNPESLEDKAAQDASARTNAVINNANGITQAAPTPAADIAPEDPRNQENIVLQNVGSQLAQTVPPSSIISVLG